MTVVTLRSRDRYFTECGGLGGAGGAKDHRAAGVRWKGEDGRPYCGPMAGGRPERLSYNTIS